MGGTAIMLDVAAVGTILLFGYIGALGKFPRISGLGGFVLGLFVGIFLIALVPILSTRFYTNLHGNSEYSIVVDSLSGILSYVILRTTSM